MEAASNDTGAFAAPPPRRPAFETTCRPLDHSGITLRSYYAMHALGASVPLVAGLALFGWRAGATVAMTAGGAGLAALAWRTIGRRGARVQLAPSLWMGMLLGLMLPPHLASTQPPIMFDGAPAPGGPPWPLAVGGGFLVALLMWAGGGVGRIHPALYAYLLLFACGWSMLGPTQVLARDKLWRGDVMRAPAPPASPSASSEAWTARVSTPGHDAHWSRPPADWLTQYTRGILPPDRGRIPLHELLRERMPPLEDLVIGGQPAAVGCGSLIAVIVGGLFLLYRGLIDFRVPLLAILAAYAAFLLLPVPAVLTERGPVYHWFVARQPDVMWEQAITFANYELAASPAVFAVFFLATSPANQPMARGARVLYALLVGVLVAASQLYVSAAVGPYLAVAGAGVLASFFDRWFPPRTLL